MTGNICYELALVLTFSNDEGLRRSSLEEYGLDHIWTGSRHWINVVSVTLMVHVGCNAYRK